MVTFEGTHHNLTASEITGVEEELGVKLPSELRKHYLRYNGGQPNPRFFEKDGEW